MRALNNVLPRLLCQPKAVPTTPGTPKQVRHRHVRRNCDTTFAFVDDPSPSDLIVANLNPRFILPNDQISVDRVLELKLNELLSTEHKDLLSARSV